MNNFQDNINIFRNGPIDNPLSNEPTWLSFSLDFNINSIFREDIGMPTSPLFDVNSINGTYQYLINRGYNYQANQLLKFIKYIDIYSTQMPWFFQSIGNLNELWTSYTNMSNNYKGFDKKIIVETLESLDLSITHLADLYRSAIYDSRYMREIVPDNLRYFSCDIYVSEYRNMIIDDDKNHANYDFAIKNKQYLKYECTMCEFDFTLTAPIDRLTVSKPDMAKNKFNIIPHFYIEKHEFGLKNKNSSNSSNGNFYSNESSNSNVNIQTL
jgi:hypothetical protein